MRAVLNLAIEPFRNPVDPLTNPSLINVVEQHLVPLSSKHLCDAPTHLTRTDY